MGSVTFYQVNIHVTSSILIEKNHRKESLKSINMSSITTN